MQVVGSPCEPSQTQDAQMPDVTPSQHSCCPAAAGAGHFARKEITSSPLVGFHLVCRWLWCNKKAPSLPKQFLIPLLISSCYLTAEAAHVSQRAKGGWELSQPCPGSRICGMSKDLATIRRSQGFWFMVQL